MSDIVERLRGRADRYRQLWGNAAYYTEGDALFDEKVADLITSLRAELERKDAALREITELEPRPSTLYPADWREQIAACPECQRYKDHPIQRGICDTHRRPIYATERHNEHETRILGYRAKNIALAALSPAQKEGEA